MIPTKSNQFTQVGELPGKKTPMTIDEVHMPHILEVLTHMYSDIMGAIIRELSINALDSHVNAGQTRPIEVTTPNTLSRFLTIRDYGTGMSVDFVEEVFSRYGASTKRGTNKETGFFGIGGKSPLAYTDAFAMRTVHQGVEAEFVIARNAEGRAEITRVVEPHSSDEPDGVEFSIPAKQTSDFDDKVEWFFKFWEPGTVLVNGVEPRRHGGEELSDKIYFTSQGGQSYVVMGSIAYKVNANSYRNKFRNFAYIAYVPTGSVSVTPARENLEYNTETEEVLRAIGDEFADLMTEQIRNDITSQPDHFSAWQKWNQWRTDLGYNDREVLGGLKYKGDEFVDSIELDGYKWSINAYRRGFNRLQWAVNIKNDLDEQVVILTDKANPKPWEDITSYMKQKTRWWMTENSIRAKNVFFLNSLPDSPWVKGLKVHSWSEIQAVKNPNYVPAARRAKGVIDTVVPSGYISETRLEDLPTDRPLIMVPAQDLRDRTVHGKNLVSGLANLDIHAVVVKVPANRWDKFKRDHKNAVELVPFVKDQIKLAEVAVSPKAWQLKSLRTKSITLLSHLNANLVERQETKDLITLAGAQKTKYLAQISKIESLVGSITMVSWDYSDRLRGDWLLENYPLMGAIDEWAFMNAKPEYRNDIYTYINAVDAAREETP